VGLSRKNGLVYYEQYLKATTNRQKAAILAEMVERQALEAK